MKRILFILAASFVCVVAGAQTRYLSHGKIFYERRVNQLKPFEDQGENTWITEMRKTFPRFVNDYFVLSFNNEKSVYRLEKETPQNKYMWGTKPSEEDVVVQHLQEGRVSLQREVFENTYLVQDSLRQLEWRITDETREIAGFQCRKAVTRICDSVYVVAFYTDDILVSSGPESFGGLPGMILGLAVPRLYTTWFATRVEIPEPAATELSPKQKGKKVSWAQLSQDLMKGLKDWGKEGARQVWKALL